MVNRLGLSLPRKSVVRLTDSLNMSIAVDWDVKPQNNNRHDKTFNLHLTAIKNSYTAKLGPNHISAKPWHTIFEPRHEKTCLYHMQTTKAQISAFVVRCLDSLTPIS